MEQLVLDKKDSASSPDGQPPQCSFVVEFFVVFFFYAEWNQFRCKSQTALIVASRPDEAADWEEELQQQLQEYEVVTESDNKDDQWEQEIEKMLQSEDS